MTLAEGMQKLNAAACVLLDLRLPDGNGVEILRYIRRLELPVKGAIVTGSTDFSTVAFASLLQPDAIFRKPVNAQELAAWVTSRCCNSAGGREVEATMAIA